MQQEWLIQQQDLRCRYSQKDRFVDAIKQVVAANAAYVPPYGSGATLYVRPYMFGSSPVIGVKPAESISSVYLPHRLDHTFKRRR